MEYRYRCIRNLENYQSELEKLERRFTYSLLGGYFSLSHGKEYAAFAHLVGDPVFVLIEHGKNIIGILTLIKKHIVYQNQWYPALYISDLKIDPAYQLTGLANDLYYHVWQLIAGDSTLRDQALVFFAAMQLKTGGDFTSIKHEDSPLYLFKELGSLCLFLTTPQILSDLPVCALDEGLVSDEFLNLSPQQQLLNLVDLQGIKDFVKEGKRLNLVHLVLAASCNVVFLEKLQAAGIAASSCYQWCCFAVDTRRYQLLEYLERHKIQANTTVKMYGYLLAHAVHSWKAVVIDTYDL